MNYFKTSAQNTDKSQWKNADHPGFEPGTFQLLVGRSINWANGSDNGGQMILSKYLCELHTSLQTTQLVIKACKESKDQL